MPPVSERQRRAMAAAAHGHSTLGIPKSVGKEFMGADPGGKLPASKHKVRAYTSHKHHGPPHDHGMGGGKRGRR